MGILDIYPHENMTREVRSKDKGDSPVWNSDATFRIKHFSVKFSQFLQQIRP